MASALAAVPAPSLGAGPIATPGAYDGPEIIRAGVVSNPNTVINGGAGMRDPQAAINAGYDTQTARAENFIQQAMSYVNGGSNIFERATRGRFINGLLNATVGPNNVGQVQGQGQDVLNSALAGIQSAGLGANASIFGSQAGLAGNAQRVGEANYEFENSGQPTGQAVRVINGIPELVTTYGALPGSRTRTPISTEPAPVYVVGNTYTDKNGNKAVYQADGSWKPAGK